MRARTAFLPCLAMALALGCGAGRAQSISALATQAEAERSAQGDQHAGAPSAPGLSAGAETSAAQLNLTLPVPSVTLYPGDALTPAVLTDRPAPRNVVESGMYAPRADALAGKVARRVLPAGVPISMSSVTDAIMVTKGVTARVILKEGGLHISGYATPLESGSAGAIVRLKNIDSGQIIIGEVQADGSVRIKMR
ncbi:flagellar basal body P-ring formation chaperone FlgA [Xanthobacter agilis]|uniref:Flagella basal body P-ring formation protein FlgA n=1 Tax=Xanthobacter agilis TaxID=47492 RepID=A0ABU0LHQ0_XANAG|nr:flagellar basal body P-ring formation chaperone FlgA [Xanthobacter agilis]MDQ0506666.1 flagella basal body P-ring formation protein FlgA [Xanthobacter agilis]